MKKIFSILVYGVILVVAILSFIHVDFSGRRFIVFGGAIYLLLEYIVRTLRKKNAA